MKQKVLCTVVYFQEYASRVINYLEFSVVYPFILIVLKLLLYSTINISLRIPLISLLLTVKLNYTPAWWSDDGY